MRFSTAEFKHNDSERKNGFTITELLVGALVASLTVAAGLKLSQVIVNNNKQSERNSAAIELADSAIDQIQQEIRNGEQLIDLESELPKGCDTYKQQGIRFLFAVDIPDQAMSLGDYDISSGKPDLKTIKCPIVYGTKGSNNGTKASNSGIELHRIGTDLNQSGYYMASKTSQTLVLRKISQETKRSLQCPNSKWKHIKRGGIEVCIDQRLKRMAKLTITMNNERDLPGSTAEGKTTQRQGSAMTEVMKQDAVAGANSNTVSKCKSGSGCNFGGQPISCDKTSFLIDVSGSMNWQQLPNYPWWQWGGLNSRMQRAKRELLRAIDSCSDEAEINVSYFSTGRGSFFQTPQKLTASNRALIRQKINALSAGGWTRPFQSIHGMVNDKNVKEIVVLSDGGTTESTWGYVYLGGRRYYGEYAKSYQKYNQTGRVGNEVKIKSISFGGGNYCGSGWMGRLADMNGGTCVMAP